MKTVSLPPLTRAVVVIFTTLSLLCVLLRYSAYNKLVSTGLESAATGEGQAAAGTPQFGDVLVPYLTLVPSLSITYPWTVATTTFVEQTVVGFLITGGTLTLGGRYCERAWSSRELATFLGLQAVIPTLVATVSLVVLYALTGREQLLLSPVNGGIAVQIGLLVAFKQLVPEHSIVLFNGAVRVQVKYLMLPALTVYTVFGLAVGSPTAIILAWSGFFTSWTYLRFYRAMYVDSLLPLSGSLTGNVTQRTKIRGDASDTFAIANFFYPTIVRDVIAAISGAVFEMLVAIKLCTPFNQEQIDAGNQRAANASSRKQAGAESDRRRALALKALEERLGANAQG